RGALAISSLTAKGTVILASAIDADTHVEGLTLHAVAPEGANAGLGAYGVRLVGGGATLFVRYDAITTEAGQPGGGGGDGRPGDPGLPGNRGQDGSNGSSAGGGG